MKKDADHSALLRRERWQLLVRLDAILDVPMNILAFLWLILTVIDLISGLNAFGELIVNLVWVLFGVHFIVELLLAPDKLTYIKHKWLTAVSLLIPAIRVLRVFRAVRLVRGASFLRVIGAINRGMGAVSESLGRKGLGYVLATTFIVIIGGAAGMMYLEKESSSYFENFASALWWTSMMVTTMGSDSFPKSAEGRLLALLLAVYGFAVFGYLTASVASFFIDQQKQSKSPSQKEIQDLQKEVRSLREALLEQKSPR